MEDQKSFRLKIVDQVHHHIETNLSHSLSIKEFSEKHCLSYSAFRHLYEETTNEPLWHYIKRYRAEYAAGLLRHSNYSCVDIGDMIGYGSKHAFSKAFSNQYGLSPVSFRSLSILPTDKVIAGLMDETVFENLGDFQSLQDNGLLRFETIINQTYFYRKEYVADTGSLMKLTQDFLTVFPGKDIVVSTPEIVCVNGLEVKRMNYGFLDRSDSRPENFFSRKITNQNYFVYSYRGPLQSIGVYLYKLIDIGKRTGQLFIRDHNCMVIVHGKNGSAEIWIPV
jgi:AraC-like DNA-binding protein